MKTHITPCPTAKSNAGALSPLTECARVVIADPYPVIRQGLTKLLEAEPDFRIVAHCADSASCIKTIQEFQPDIAIVDMSLPEILQVISSEGFRTRIVFFTALEEREQRLFHARSVHAVVRKDADPQSLLQTLRQVASGQKVLQLPLYGQAASGEGAEKAITAMTDRERQIMRLVSEGLSNKEIGRRLHIMDGTIKVHLHHIFQKLVVGNRTALAALYLNHDSGNQGKEPDHD